MEEKQNIESLLLSGKTVQLHPKGYSMYPMFVPGRDEAVIAPVNPEKIRRGDVILYRRTAGILVLHRVVRKKADGFYLTGDNQSAIEGPIESGQVKGKLIAFIRKGRYVSVENPLYRMLAKVWLCMRVVRRPIMVTGAAVKRTIKKILH